MCVGARVPVFTGIGERERFIPSAMAFGFGGPVVLTGQLEEEELSNVRPYAVRFVGKVMPTM